MMQMVGLALQVVGMLIGLAGSIWLLVIAFQRHWGWGLACLCIPCAAIVFAIQNWDEAGKPFLIAVGGNLLAVIGQAIIANAAGGGGPAF